MDYEQKYKEALERAEKALEVFGTDKCEGARQIFSLFPELKESEDERIRKAIIGTLPKYGYLPQTAIKVEDALTWLEKQGSEQKPILDFKARNWYVNKVDGKIHDITYNPTDKVEPKFKVGDYIVNDYCMGRVVEITDDAYLLDTEQGIPFSCEHNVHLWTIQDAKDGDVLVSRYNKPFIYNGNRDSFHIGSYCGISVEDRFIVATEKCHWTENVNIHPATKEQRDLLFQKMHEAGYEWDADKKELKKVRQKLTELAKGEDYGIDGLYAAVDILQKTLGEVDGYQTDDGILEHECAISAVKKLYEQNPTWSEEDDYNLQCMIAKVTSDIQKGNVGRNNELIDWLKSIKERVQPQPMQEWSEEDEKKRNLLINILNVNHPNGYFKANPANTLNMEAIHTEELVSWLKSIKEKVQPKQEWSDEDEFRLNRTVENIELLNDANGNILFKDIEWLKSLKNRLSKVKNC